MAAADPASAFERVESLRSALRARFGARVDPTVRRERRAGEPIPSGWTRVDAAVGGLRPGESVLVDGAPGAGSLALASSWAREASIRGVPVLVIDGLGSSLPHAWVEAEAARAPVWVVRCATPHAESDTAPLWPALDVALRAGAFGLALVLDPPLSAPGVGARIVRLAQEHGTRLLLTQSRLAGAGARRAPPWPPTHRVGLRAGSVRWVEGPAGAAPVERTLEVVGERGQEPGTDDTAEGERRRDLGPNRMCPDPRTPDRRPPSKRGGRTRR
ncbi:MAG: hypothetical protein AB8I08_04345 [Sandaracinaceae bacterium]